MYFVFISFLLLCGIIVAGAVFCCVCFAIVQAMMIKELIAEEKSGLFDEKRTNL